MVQDPLIEKLVKSAVNRCRERIITAKKQFGGGPKRSGETENQKEPPGFTDALKRLRGL
ncbi:MAG: hypothetical protein ABSD81_04915 [Methanomicrobiales archaeon]|jgi:hypothetical protein